MAHIDDVPTSVTGAGQDHDYEPSYPLAQLVLVSARVDPDHQNVGLSKAAYDAYFTAEITAGRAYQTTLNNFDPGRPIDIQASLSSVAGYNYGRLRFDGHDWYVFVSARYLNRTVTRLETTIDPWFSYGSWSLGYGMVARGHVAVAASQGDTYGDQYCGAPELISAPPERGVRSESVLSSDPSDWTVMVISANDLRGYATATPYFERHTAESDLAQAVDRAYEAGVGPAAPGDDWLPTSGGDHGFSRPVYETPYPWHDSGTDEFYVPSVKPSLISTVDGIPQGGGAYLFTVAGWNAWLNVVQGASWIMEGITGFELISSWAAPAGGDGTPGTGLPPTSPTAAAWSTAAGIPVFAASVTTTGYDTTVMAGWRDDYLSSVGAGIYRKLITSAHVQVAVGNGESVATYAPDQMPTSGVNVHAVTGAAHGERSIRLTVDYNELGPQQAVSMAAGGHPGSVASGYGRAAANTASADMGPLNSAYGNYFNRQVMGYQNALAVHLDQTQRQMNMGIIGVQSVLQAGTGAAVAGFAGGGPIGAVAGAVLGGGASLVTAGISSNNSLDMLDTSQAGSVDIGSYQLAVSGAFNTLSFRAWVQGLKATSGRGTGAALASAWRAITGQAFHVVIVAPEPSRVRELLSTWKRYGYMIGRAFTPPRLDAMSRFSYWQTEGATVVGDVPQVERQQIAAAFDRGVTVWSDLSLIGTDQTGANTPTPGVTY